MDMQWVLRSLATFGFDVRLRSSVVGAGSSREIALRVKREEERRLLR